MGLSLLHVMGFAFLVSLSVSGFMMAARISDVPDARSSHNKVTPTAGGLGIVAGMAAALMAVRFFYPEMEDALLFTGLSGLGLLVAAIGLLDDRFTLPTGFKFFIIAVLALAAPLITGVPEGFPVAGRIIDIPYIAAYAGAALWIFVVVNAVNFMDGANGLMGSFMTVAGAGLTAYAMLLGKTDVALIAGALTAAIAGFLPYNARPNARIFCGDTGALFVGFIFACSCLHMSSASNVGTALYVGPILILPFLADVLLTLIIRLKRKENLLSAHKSHQYHVMLAAGRSHMQVAFSYFRGAVLMVLAAIVGGYTGLIGTTGYLMIWGGIVSGLYVLRRRSYARQASALN